jgi:hypothetical protein
VALGPLPDPPIDLSQRPIRIIEFSDSIFRTHAIDRSPIFFGRSRANRFDAVDGSFGVLYAGRDLFCAFIETFAWAAGTQIVTTAELQRRGVSELKAVRPLRLIDLTRSGALVRIGADARLFSGDHSVAQRWSFALHEHPSKADGLMYPSRLDPEKHGLALFEDRTPELITLNRQSWYAPGPLRLVLADVMERYQLKLIENRFVAGRKPASGTRSGKRFGK